MVSDKIGGKLHDRSTRGQALTDAEKKQLEEWYSYMDAREAISLKMTGLNLKVPEELGIQLHHRHCLGETLLPEEQLLLNAWHHFHDEKEQAMLEANMPRTGASQEYLDHLRSDIKAILERLVNVAKKNSEIAAATEALRLENETLMRQLGQKRKKQAA